LCAVSVPLSSADLRGASSCPCRTAACRGIVVLKLESGHLVALVLMHEPGSWCRKCHCCVPEISDCNHC
jgi:hypothetical protein